MTELHNLWPDSNRAVLVVVDIQERLILSMPEEPLKRTIKSSTTLINGCKVLNIPILATEQYSKGLGPTISEVKDALGDVNPIEKMTFSCYEEPSFRRALETLGERAVDIILCGIESHVCVLQTVLDLLEDEYNVYVAADAVCSRAKLNWETSLKLMRQAGAVIGTTEIFLFQMLEEAGTERFKQISKLVR